MANKRPLTAEEVTDQKALVREGWLPDLARLFDTIEQQREQIAALTRLVDGTANIEEIAAHQDVKPLASITQLEGMWPGEIYERPPSLAAGIAALENRLVGTEAENGLLNTRYQNLQTDMELLEKERDSLLAELQRWYGASGSVGALRPRS